MTLLITGATGYIGRRVALRIAGEEKPIRLLVRDPDRLDPALRNNRQVEIVVGDVSDENVAARACAGVSQVLHLAGAMNGSPEDFDRSTILGTKTMLEAATRAKVPRFVYISSMSVYDYSGVPSGASVDENAPLEANPESRNDYARSKRVAESIVAEHVAAGSLQICIVRPGIVYGPNGRPALIAVTSLRRAGKKFHALVGGGRREVPLVYVENLVDALLLFLEKDWPNGRAYNVIDPGPPSEREYLKTLERVTGTRMRVIPVPERVILPLAQAAEFVRRRRRRGGMNIVHGLRRVTGFIRFDTALLRRELGWKSRVRFTDAMAASFGKGSSETPPRDQRVLEGSTRVDVEAPEAADPALANGAPAV